MDIFGIGASELFFILLFAIIILGPKDMQKAGRTVGRWLNQMVRSDGWKAFQRTSTEIRNLPRNLMREANLEEAGQQLAEANEQIAATQKELNRPLDPRPAPPTAANQPQSPAAAAPPPPAATSPDDVNDANNHD